MLKDDSEGRRSPFQDLVFGITGHPIVLSNGGTQVFAIAPVGGSFYISVLSEGPDDWSPSVLVADDFFASAAVLKDGKSIRHIGYDAAITGSQEFPVYIISEGELVGLADPAHFGGGVREF